MVADASGKIVPVEDLYQFEYGEPYEGYATGKEEWRPVGDGDANISMSESQIPQRPKNLFGIGKSLKVNLMQKYVEVELKTSSSYILKIIWQNTESGKMRYTADSYSP